MTPFHQFIKYLNLSLVVVFPFAWFSPLLTTGLLPPWHMACMAGRKETIRARYTDRDNGYPSTMGNGCLTGLGCDILRIGCAVAEVLRHGSHSLQPDDGSFTTGDNNAGQARHGGGLYSGNIYCYLKKRRYRANRSGLGLVSFYRCSTDFFGYFVD
jgi:hypothetical protein